MNNLLRYLDRAYNLRESFEDVRLQSIICEHPKSAQDNNRECPFKTGDGVRMAVYHLEEEPDCDFEVRILEAADPWDAQSIFSADALDLLNEFSELCELIHGSKDRDAVPRVCIRIHRAMKLQTSYRPNNSRSPWNYRDEQFGTMPVHAPRWSRCDDLLRGLEHLSHEANLERLLNRPTVADDPNDGPSIVGSFVWKGQTYSGLQPTPWRLLDHVWNCSDRCASYDCLAEAVWQDHNYEFEGGPLKKAAQKVRQFFRDSDIPLEINTCRRARTVKISESS